MERKTKGAHRPEYRMPSDPSGVGQDTTRYRYRHLCVGLPFRLGRGDDIGLWC